MSLLDKEALPGGARSRRRCSGTNDREATASEEPRHQVTISKPFYLGKFEVTQAQWEAVMGSSPYTGQRSNPFSTWRAWRPARASGQTRSQSRGTKRSSSTPGSWGAMPGSAKTSRRDRHTRSARWRPSDYELDYRGISIGFRLAMDVE
jgi:sulfatase-modifying factor enzyme 1